ncbi:MAG: branched-chain amino acid ABC transporter ATP-binding protein/permease [Actinomycetota bacterium]
MKRFGLTLASLVALVGVAAAAGHYWELILTLGVVYALASLSLVVLTGWTGQLNLHVSALGLGWGAYATYALLRAHVPSDIAIAFACVLTIPFAAIVAAIAVRFRGLELAVATLAIGLIFERLAFRNIGKFLSRSDRNITTFGSSFVRISRSSLVSSDLSYFIYSLIVASVLFAIANLVSRGFIGRTLKAVRQREAMASTLGINVVGYRAGAFIFSIVIAAAAGALLAGAKLGVTPDEFNIDLSFRLLAGAVIGGIASPGGAVIGGALMAVLPEVFGGEKLFLLFGLGMIVTLWRRSSGLVGFLGRRSLSAEAPDAGEMLPRLLPSPNPRNYKNPLQRHARPTALRASGVSLSFGGVVALDDVEISISRGEVVALIGPNGAGKSTLNNCISGLLEPSAGRVYLNGRDITELSAHERASLGIGRTYQTVEVFRSLSVLDNLIVAGHPMRTTGAVSSFVSWKRSRRDEQSIVSRANEVADSMGLAHVCARAGGELPLGLLRVLEVGMALMPRPSVLLLDEPTAGLDAAETRMLAALIWKAHLDYDCAVLLVEHDMDFVSSIAEHVYVLDFGRVIAQGTPAQILRDPLVLERYLGTPASANKGERSNARR